MKINVPIGLSTSTLDNIPNLLNHFSSFDHESSKPVILKNYEAAWFTQGMRF